MNYEETVVAGKLFDYERALNASHTGAVMKRYSLDGVFIQHHPSRVGSDAICAAYDAVFGTLRLDVKLQSAKMRFVAADWAFARTHSAGTVTALATGASARQANQELLVPHTIGSEWKIARYCFSTTSPSR